MALIPIDKDEFDQVMRQVDQISQHEFHLEKLEAGYRKMASVWLLAALLACGLILKSKSTIPFDAWYLIIAVATATSVGIGILWMLDLKVYHRLVHIYLAEGIRLEQSFSWLRPVRSHMFRFQKSGVLVRRVQFFYFVSILLLLAVIGIGFCNMDAWEHNFFNKWASCIGLAAIAVFLLIRMLKPIRDSYAELVELQASAGGFGTGGHSTNSIFL